MIIARSIHVAVNGIISFFFMAELYSIVYVYHIFFTHLSVNGHLGCFHVLATATPFVKKTILSLIEWSWLPRQNQLTIDVWFYFWTLNSIPLVYMSVFIPVPCCFDYYSFAISFESTSPPTLLFFKIVLAM